MKVLIADDHGIVRSGLRMLLERQMDIEVVGEASDGGAVDVVALHADLALVAGGDDRAGLSLIHI